MSKKFHITTGDVDGIGLEVTLKSLLKIINKTPKAQYDIWIHKSQEQIVTDFVKKNKLLMKKISFSTDYNSVLNSKKFNFILNKKPAPAHWFVEASKICLKNNHSVITAPLSKTQINLEGFKEIGHTELLKTICKKKDLKMAFSGKHFSIILYTDHIPIHEVKVDTKDFKTFISLALEFHKTMKNSKSDFFVLGLNPHAGDSGLIGSEDKKILSLVKNFGIKQLLPADSAFVDFMNFKNNPTFVSMYHDQGLIPFKMAHGFSGFHFTLGLPFVRTSVDHGTAKNIFGKNTANPKSMTDALLGAFKLSHGNIQL